jgi:hypothetical protein
MAFTVGRYGIKSIGSLGLLIGTFYGRTRSGRRTIRRSCWSDTRGCLNRVQSSRRLEREGRRCG